METVNILSLAGFDPSGGAGILGDIKAIEASGGYGMGVITTHTVQSTNRVKMVRNSDVNFFQEQLKTLLEEEMVHAMKIGLIGNKTNQINEAMEKINHIVFDPIIFSTSGYKFIQDEEIDTLVNKIFPKITLLTPNFLEAELLLEGKIDGNNIEESIRKIGEKCQCNILLKGGHSFMKGQDILYDGKQLTYFNAETIINKEAHGTGCSLSASIATYLGKGYNLIESITEGKETVYNGLLNSYERKLNYGK